VVLLAGVAILWVVLVSPLGQGAAPPQAVSPLPETSEPVVVAGPVPPLEPPRTRAEAAVGRRASDEELRKQLPPGATLAE
jgi:hypothetical protein